MTACTLNGATSTFTYGADGLRRSMTVGGVTTYYVYDGQTLIREMQGEPGSLHATATYLSGPRGPEYRRDDTRQETDGQGKTYLGTARWYVYDGLGSVVGEVDPAGNVTASDRYDVYGAVRGRTGSASTAHGFVGSLGHLSDAATGLVYMRARYYDPATGRFSSEDSGASGNNWFVYCSDNPVNRLDASGKADAAVDAFFQALGMMLMGVGLAMMAHGVTEVRGGVAETETALQNALSIMGSASSNMGGLGLIGSGAAMMFGAIGAIEGFKSARGGVLSVIIGYKVAQSGAMLQALGEDGFDMARDNLGELGKKYIE